MKVRQSLEITASHRNIKDGDPPTRISLLLTVEDAQRGDAVVSSIEKALDGARRAIVDALDRRPY